jgi:hypothetical protein
MIYCIHVVAYFSWSDEVLLYFIVQVEFKLICNLQNRFEKEKEFLIWNRLRAEFDAASPCARGLRGPVDSRACTA